MRGKNKKKRKKTPAEEWTCSLCGRGEQQELSCSGCEAERVVPEGEEAPLWMLRGMASISSIASILKGEGEGDQQATFMMNLLDGRELQVILEPRSKILPGPDAELPPADEEEVELAILGRVELRFEELEGGLRDAPVEHLTCAASVLAVGGDAATLMAPVVREIKGLPEPRPVPEPEPEKEEELPDRVQVERRGEVRGKTTMRIIWSPEFSDLYSLRFIPLGLCLFYGSIMARVGVERGLNLALLLLIPAVPAAYFWLAKLNRRIIRLDARTISLRFAPLPWPGWSRPRSEVTRLDMYETSPHRTAISSFHPDSLYVSFRDGTDKSLVKEGFTRQIYFLRDLLNGALRLQEHEVTDQERTASNRVLKRKLVTVGGPLLLILFAGQCLWPGHSLLLRDEAVTTALSAASECHLVRKRLGQPITWAVGWHTRDMGCDEEAGEFRFAIKGPEARGSIFMSYCGDGCGKAHPHSVIVTIGGDKIDAKRCLPLKASD